jgi:hypothetical protein
MAVVAYSDGQLYCMCTKPGTGGTGHQLAVVANRDGQLYCICIKSYIWVVNAGEDAIETMWRTRGFDEPEGCLVQHLLALMNWTGVWFNTSRP